MPRSQLRLVGLRAVGPGGLTLRSPPSSLTQSRVLRSLLKILEGTALCSLATVAPDNVAHSSHVYFAYSSQLDLYFLSDPNSNHCRHLSRNPTMAVSVYDSTQRWGGPDCGVALYGTCMQARGRNAGIAEQVYRRRFRAFTTWRAGLTPGEVAETWRFYRFRASRVKVFDEAPLGPGVFAVASVHR